MRDLRNDLQDLDDWETWHNQGSDDSEGITHFTGSENREDIRMNYSSINKDDVKNLLQCQMCWGQMSESNHLMCNQCSKTWWARCFKEALKHDKRCPNCRKPITKKQLIKNCLLMEFMNTQSSIRIPKISNDNCKTHNEEANLKWIDWDEKLWNEWVCSEAHRGHVFKTLKAIYSEVKNQANEAQDNLKAYSKQIEDSEYTLKIVKILKEDSTANAIYSILAKLKNWLMNQSYRVSSSFSFIDDKIIKVSPTNISK